MTVQQIAGLHKPVLFDEVLEFLAPRPGGRYLDATLGLGGHSEGILERIAPGGELLGLDRDAQALALAQKRLERFGEAFRARQGTFSEFEAAMDDLNWDVLDGALIDIGISSLQLDFPERGFSFSQDGPLDMRMDPESGQPASRLVNKAPFEALRDIIATAGEDPQAGRIARAIVQARAKKPIESTGQLAAIVEAAYPAKWRATARNHPATRTFQALRMTVNNELGELRMFLERIVPRLAPGGRLAVISFHSLEDRAVKRFFRQEATDCLCPPQILHCACGHRASLKILTKKPVSPGEAECAANTRAASARLRAAEKLLSPQ